MAQVGQSKFTKYSLSKDEEISGSILNMNQEFVLQNLLVSFAEQLLDLEIDTDKPLEYVKQKSHCQGIIHILQYLLDTSATLKTQPTNKE